MAVAFDAMLPLDPTLPAHELVQQLSRLKNMVIGHGQRKVATLRNPGLQSLVMILREQPGASPDEVSAIVTQAADILGALSMPTPDAVLTLLSVQAHSTLISVFNRLLAPKLPSMLPTLQQYKLAETLLRAIKSLYLDLGRVALPRVWGTDIISTSSDPAERRDVRLQWEEEAAAQSKGKAKEDPASSIPTGRPRLQDLGRLAYLAFEEIYAVSPAVPPSTVESRTPFLARLIALLQTCQNLQYATAPAALTLPLSLRIKFTDMICSLLAGTVRLPEQSYAVIMGDQLPVFGALTRLILVGSPKVQISAFNAISALVRPLNGSEVRNGWTIDPFRLFPVLIPAVDSCMHSSDPTIRLAAYTVVIVSSKNRSHVGLLGKEEIDAILSPLLELVETNKALRTQAVFVLTYLIAESQHLQELAIKLTALDLLRKILEEPPDLPQPYATAASLEESARLKEGCLLAIACICTAKSDSFKHDVLRAKLLPLIIRCLSHPSAGVRAAACHCLRGLGRSVNVLRTSLVDAAAAKPLYALLREGEDTVVQITAAAAVSNLLLEFSPIRPVLVSEGCIPRLCDLAKSEDTALRFNALWALKNACYQSTCAFKRSTMSEFGWDHLAALIQDPDVTISEQALGMLRNLTCTYGNDPVTGLAPSEMGETRMLDILESKLESPHLQIVLQTLYTIVNLATANETAKLAIASRNNLLQSIVQHLKSSNAETRCAAIWSIINLCFVAQADRTFRVRRPREIMDKLQTLGAHEQLRRMAGDPSLDVRERVRDALEVFAVSTGTGTIKKAIAPVPTAAQFLDVVLSSTQRKTPTVIRSGFKITRIRSFYMRKIKFTQQAFEERLDKILTDFPIMDNLHPFLSALLNVLYDKNHYKLALGQLNTARHLIVQVGKDYCRLVKFGDSLFRCKQLKKAALGRMATIMRRQKDPLAYLEEVRQHMSRLPSIDPTTRTLLICGYPNVGKSSFVNKVTRADVDVQPYAFTTKSLFVGHMDYKYLRWQVIDTPGVLDHPLEEMNTIEMQSITALAHLRSCILYFMDLSEQCGYTVEAQCQLYQSIKPLFTNKPTFIVVNKIDVTRPSDLDPERKAMLDAILAEDNVKLLELSCVSEEGVMDVRNSACDALLAHRVESKEKTRRVENVANRVRVAVPVARDGVKREAFIPAAVAARKKYDKNDPERRRVERDLEEENGGAGVYSVDSKKNYLLANDDWKYDVMPEIQDGKNVADFIDPDIVARLEELEAEEERLEAAGFYDSESEEDSDEEAIKTTAEAIRDKKANMRMLNQQRQSQQNRPVIPRSVQHRTLSEMTSKLKEAGYDASNLEERAKVLAKARGLVGKKRSAGDMEVDEDDEAAWGSDADESMDVDDGSRKKQKTSAAPKSSKRVPRTDRQVAGLGSAEEAAKAVRLRALYQRGPNMHAKASESDRHIRIKMPKHLYSGKRGVGKAHHR